MPMRAEDSGDRLSLPPAQLCRLAEVLGHACRVSEGAGLVRVLGAGQARDNREVLIEWVRAQVAELDAEVAGVLLPVLLKRLERRLQAWEDE
ncbi:hypothetical protein [Thiocapsa sp.]|uniref:hypothetical protein n=1 Tax=Thiocapsa sp. TaxID=2024551 RepID=UPI002B6BC998|nr:hypothetical protein [Thiocapsa sp.]HSO82497.1 hypothetical protein [Thiocapsa sp.]